MADKSIHIDKIMGAMNTLMDAGYVTHFEVAQDRSIEMTLSNEVSIVDQQHADARLSAEASVKQAADNRRAELQRNQIKNTGIDKSLER